jgi:predicted peptidase
MMTRRTVLAAPLALGACAQMTPPTQTVWQEGQQAFELNLPGRSSPLRMWLYLPRGYLTEPTKAWPLLVFLHGSGECGLDLAQVKLHGPPKLVAQGADYPLVLCSPQLETDTEWPADTLHQLSLALQARLRIDPARVLGTGLSLGGMGVWSWATAYPQDLAAIAPVCGFGDPAAVCRMRAVPVRAYHGEIDDVVPLADEQASVNALRACGGSAELIVYPGVGHDSWNRAYQDPALLPWLLSQRRA